MLTKIKSILLELGALGPVLAFAVLAPGLGILVLSTTHKTWLPTLQDGTFLSLTYFIILSTIFAGISLVPTHAVSLIAGLLFGAIYGPLIAILSIIFASILSFTITARLVGDKALNSLIQRPQAHGVFQELLKHNLQRTIIIISLIRLSPVMPFAGTNVLLAAAKIKITEFLLGSILGLAPRIILVTLAGAGLSELDFNQKSSQELLILGLVATIVSLVIIGRIAKKTLNNYVKINETTS